MGSSRTIVGKGFVSGLAHADKPPLLIAPYVRRAAAVVLLWSELLDDMSEAETCSSTKDLLHRRDLCRRELREFLAKSRPDTSIEKWAQRAFWSRPPRSGFLDADWREPLFDWIRGMKLPAGHSLELAVASLFPDGIEAWTQLVAERPEFCAKLADLVRGPIASPPIANLVGTALLEHCQLPAYLTDPDLTLIWSNTSLQAFLGLAADRVAGLKMAEFISLVGQMALPNQRKDYVREQTTVIASSKIIGQGHIELDVDLARRHWTLGRSTPPWEGKFHIEAHAHFVYDPASGERLGSAVIIHPLRLSAP